MRLRRGATERAGLSLGAILDPRLRDPWPRVVLAIIPRELDIGGDVMPGNEEGASREHPLGGVGLGQVAQLETGRIRAVIDQAHHVALLAQVNVRDVVVDELLALECLLVEAHDVLLVTILVA